MTIFVSGLSRVADMISLHAPTRVVSLLDPDSAFPELGPAYAGRHLRLRFHDAHAGGDGLVMPRPEDIARLIGFIEAGEPLDPILIHCRAGIGRSTAAGFVAACLRNPSVSEHELAVTLRRVAPFARPNEEVIRLADAVMGRDGRMSEAIRSTGRGLSWIDTGEPHPFQLPSR